MHTHAVATPLRPIYWTTQAQEVFAEEIRAVVRESWTPGGQIIAGNHSCRITGMARARGRASVCRALVLEYFARLADRGQSR